MTGGPVPARVDALLDPRRTARAAASLTRELVSIAAGTGAVAPAGDKPFADPAWTATPAYRRLAQGYLTWSSTLQGLVDRYEADGADWRKVERARFAVTALTAALAPTNTFWGNPAAVKRAVDTG